MHEFILKFHFDDLKQRMSDIFNFVFYLFKLQDKEREVFRHKSRSRCLEKTAKIGRKFVN